MPVLLEVAEAELEHGLLGLGRQAQRLLELVDRARELALFPQDVAEQDVRRRDRRASSARTRAASASVHRDRWAKSVPSAKCGRKASGLRSTARFSAASAAAVSPDSEAAMPL